MGKKVIELGSGTGYASLVLASLGWEVTATDIEPVLSSVLSHNVTVCKRVLLQHGLPAEIKVGMIDWEQYASGASEEAMEVGTKRWDMIVMTDTLYASHLIDPLWKTLIRLSSNTIRPPSLSLEQDKSERGAASPIYFALESRDPAMIAQALDRGRALRFELKKVGGRVGKTLRKWGWYKNDWEGVEIWKGRYKAQS
nr:hypothetical protein L203_00946 [Cryptococcus depauperatus CBS 7841]